MTDPAELPEGTVTFLFTDLEGSTRLLQAHPAAYREAVARHHVLLREAVEGQGGVVFETVGDAVYAAFARATDAVAAALAGQLALQTADWGGLGAGALKARMGLHTGEVERQGGHYFGAPLYRCARLAATAYGGQVVLSGATAELVQDELPDGRLRDLGAHRLKDLQRPERVFQLVHPDLPGDFPPLRSLDPLRHNLPLQLTSFVGREAEVAEVRRRLGAERLLTLTGTGGTGKTRLALQAAADSLEAYPDGVWLVELAPLADPALVPQAVAAAVGAQEEPGRPLLATLAAALAPRRLLLLLDNCEHLLEACARLADALLRACPDLTVLATSREALGIAGEAVFPVPSLALPARGPVPSVAALSQYEAVRLFIERAKAARPAFAVTDHNAPAVAQICARLDGIPLAIELAAARLRVLPVETLLTRLEDRFRLLTGGSRTALARQQTLQAAVDWSYELLSDQEQALFARLSVFAGGFTLEAAEAVCAGEGIETAEVLDLLGHLVEKSLVALKTAAEQRGPGESDGRDGSDESSGGAGGGRYWLLETLRQYGQDKLTAAGAAAARDRHLACFLALAERADPALKTPAAPAWIERLEAEHDNLRAALEWSLADASLPAAAEQGLRLAAALWYFWFVRVHHQEGHGWLERALARTGESPRAVRAHALAGTGVLAFNAGPGRAPLGVARLAESAAMARRLGDAAGAARALGLLGWWSVGATGDTARSRAAFQDSLTLARQAGDPTALAWALVLAANRPGLFDDQTRQRLATEGLAAAEAVGDLLSIGMAHRTLGQLALARGDTHQARASFAVDLAHNRSLKQSVGVMVALDSLGRVALREQDYPEAESRFQEVLTLWRALGRPGFLDEVPRALNGLGDASLARGARTLARHYFGQSLALGAGMPDARTQARIRAAALDRLAALDAAEGQAQRALRLAGAASALRQAAGAPPTPTELADLDRRLEPARQSLPEAAAAAAWAAGQTMSLEQAVAAALEDAPAPPDDRM